eukprot:1727339-Rhodomonas_salina.2
MRMRVMRVCRLIWRLVLENTCVLCGSDVAYGATTGLRCVPPSWYPSHLSDVGRSTRAAGTSRRTLASTATPLGTKFGCMLLRLLVLTLASAVVPGGDTVGRGPRRGLGRGWRGPTYCIASAYPDSGRQLIPG